MSSVRGWVYEHRGHSREAEKVPGFLNLYLQYTPLGYIMLSMGFTPMGYMGFRRGCSGRDMYFQESEMMKWIQERQKK